MTENSLTPEQFEKLYEALLDAYDANGLERMLLFKLGIPLPHIASTRTSYKDIVFSLLKQVRQEGRLGELAEAVREDRPNNPKVAALTASLTPSSSTTSLTQSNVGRSNAADNLSAGALRQRINKGLKLTEMQDLAFDLGVDHELFPNSKSGFARELISHFQRRNNLDKLLDALRREYPHVVSN